MYQLSHMLTEQRSLLSTLATTSLLGDKIPSAVDSDGPAGSQGEGKEQKEEEESRRKLAAILEKVEGCVVWVGCHCKYIGLSVEVTKERVVEGLLYETYV